MFPSLAQRRSNPWITAALTVLALIAGVLLQLAALKAAGLKGLEPGNGGGAFKSLVDQLQQNTVWIMVTGLGFAMTCVALLMTLGSQSAPMYVFKIGGGIAILMIGIPAVLA